MEALSLIIDVPLIEVREHLDAYIESNNADVLVEEQDENSTYVHFVERTSFWRFPEDVVVAVSVVDSTSTQIELHSQSRLGQSDLGVNPERLEGLHAALLG